jgi:hypothetical protein
MAGFSDTFESDLCKLIFNATAISNVADNAATAPLTNLWVSLHTADPGDTGTQGTNEGGYTAYTRISVARTTAGWTVTGVTTVSPVANIDFPQVATTSTGTFTHAAIGVTSASTAGKIIAAGTISPNINFSQNVTPRLTTASSFTLD